jgi:2-polyprenyl-3-methyl-5-hydroxy-6-metoxy-1,4-benzoquinol methylase
MMGNRNKTAFDAAEAVSDIKRLESVHQLYQPVFLKVVRKVLNTYGLGENLKQAKATGQKVHILDVGCAEGLYLHDVAQVLEEQQLLEAADLLGIDIDPNAIAVAEEYSRLSRPPRPYLHFYVHDATQPFEDAMAFKAFGHTRFDFIYCIYTLELLPNARQQLERLYNALNPGGTIYLHSQAIKKGPEGWLSPHPSLEIFDQWMFDNIASINPGLDVSYQAADWLSEMGAIQLSSRPVTLHFGGDTDQGRKFLRHAILFIRNSLAPAMIEKGVLTQNQFDNLWATFSKELGPHLQGQTTLVNTFARKPL